MAHLQKNIEEQYEDVNRVFDMIKSARNVKEVEGIWDKFIEHNWRGKEFHSKVGGITDKLIPTGYNKAVEELTETLSKLNADLRNGIREGRNKPGMEKMTADGFEERSIKDGKGQPKDGEEFAKEKLLDKNGNASTRIEVSDAMLDLRHGGLTPGNTAAVMGRLISNHMDIGMRRLIYENTDILKEETIRLEELMRTINVNLASEYKELRGKLESQESFRNANLR